MAESNKTTEVFNVKHSNEGPKPTTAQLAFMKLVEEENIKRVKKLEILRKRNWITGWALGLSVLGIYGYTIATIRQEQFLDNFDEPEKVVDSE